MKPEFLESAEFYNRRYHNFSSRVIVPMSLLLVFLLGFATFAEKEMSLSTRATVEPSRILANIQSTSNNRILVNHLEENKLIHFYDYMKLNKIEEIDKKIEIENKRILLKLEKEKNF